MEDPAFSPDPSFHTSVHKWLAALRVLQKWHQSGKSGGGEGQWENTGYLGEGLKMGIKTSQGLPETSSIYFPVLPLARPARCSALSQPWAERSSFGQARTLQGHLWSLASQLGPFHFHSPPAALCFLPGPLAVSISQTTSCSISFGSCFFLFPSLGLKRVLSSLLPREGRNKGMGQGGEEKNVTSSARPLGEYSLHFVCVLRAEWAGTSIPIAGPWGDSKDTPRGRDNSCLLSRDSKNHWGSERQGVPSGNQRDTSVKESNW